MKFLVFDAGPLISLSLSGLIDVLEKLKTKKVEFIITPQVRKEVIDRAWLIKKYKLDAIRILNLIEEGILKNSSDFIPDIELQRESDRIRQLAKKIIKRGKEGIDIIHGGEAFCLAFSNLSKSDCVIVLDERNTRLLSESPNELKNIMEKKLRMNLTLNEKDASFFREFKFIRSSELIFLAFKKKFLPLNKNVETLDAMLYNLKFHGTAISSREIEEMKKLI